MVMDAPDQEIEKRKFLYEFARGEFNREDARWESADRKATIFTSVLVLLLGAAGYFGKWLLSEKMLPPQSCLDWVTLVCIISVFLVTFRACFLVLNAFRIRQSGTSGLHGDDLVNYFLERDLKTIHTGYAVRFARDALENKLIVDQKNECLIRSYRDILIVAVLLVALLALMGLHGWGATV